MTVLEALKATKSDLANIHVKVEDMNEIGFPLHNAVQSLKACIDALERAEAEQKAEAEKAGAEDEQQA